MQDINDFACLSTITELLDHALKGELKLDDLYKRWPKNAEGHTFFELVYDDIEDAVEHTPGDFLGNINMPSFQQSSAYFNLIADKALLQSGLDADKLCQLNLLFRAKRIANKADYEAWLKSALMR